MICFRIDSSIIWFCIDLIVLILSAAGLIYRFVQAQKQEQSDNTNMKFPFANNKTPNTCGNTIMLYANCFSGFLGILVFVSTCHMFVNIIIICCKIMNRMGHMLNNYFQ